MDNVWSAFIALNATRSAGMSANPIPYSEIKAWSELHNTPLRPWEVTAITLLDRIFMKVHSDGN